MLDARDLPDGQRLTADICIIGAGAAGIAIALELIGTGINVLLLESGDLQAQQAEDLDEVSVLTAQHDDISELHRRRFGGMVNPNDDVLAPLNPAAFQASGHVAYSGWPIDADALTAFYPRALALCESDESRRTVERDSELARKPLIPGFDDLNFSTDQVDRYGHPEDFGSRFAATLRASSNVCVLLNATVTRLQMNAAGSEIDAVMVRMLSGKSISVTATRFVLAAGALETARLLLANRDVHPNGIGNDMDNVGRFLLCPIKGRVESVALKQPPAVVWYGGGRTALRARRVLTLRAESQLKFQTGGFAARLQPQQSAHSGPIPRRWQPGDVSARTLYALEFQAEQQPLTSSRVTLGDARDALGMPRLLIDWNCSIADFETVRRSIELLAHDLSRADAGRLDYDAAALAAMMTARGPHSGNHQGTARMGADARTSVVDANGRVHGVGNLFIAGAAVFPTSGVGDPMLTLVALSLRLAEHLKKLEMSLGMPDRLQSRVPEPRAPLRLVSADDYPTDRRRATGTRRSS